MPTRKEVEQIKAKLRQLAEQESEEACTKKSLAAYRERSAKGARKSRSKKARRDSVSDSAEIGVFPIRGQAPESLALGSGAGPLLESSRVNVRGPGLTFNVKRYTLPA